MQWEYWQGETLPNITSLHSQIPMAVNSTTVLKRFPPLIAEALYAQFCNFCLFAVLGLSSKPRHSSTSSTLRELERVTKDKMQPKSYAQYNAFFRWKHQRLIFQSQRMLQWVPQSILSDYRKKIGHVETVLAITITFLSSKNVERVSDTKTMWRRRENESKMWIKHSVHVLI